MAVDPLKSSPHARKLILVTGMLTLCFSLPLRDLLRLALQDDLYSYIPLVPLISSYSVWLLSKRLPEFSAPAYLPAALFFAAGVAILTGYGLAACSRANLGVTDRLAFSISALLFLFIGACLWLLGRPMVRALAYPIALLGFMIPLPEYVRHGVETLLQYGATAVAGGLFGLSGTPYYENGLGLQLPGINLQVAAECSGIHSTLMLLLTSVLAGRLFLINRWQRLALCVAVLPLAVLRNGFRIFVIGELCVYFGPEMINSIIHRHGGPIFFILSLIPLGLLLRYFIRSGHPVKPSLPISSPINSMKKNIPAVLTLILAGLLTASLTGCSAKVKATYHLQRADKYFAASQYDQAEVEYMNVLRNNQQNLQAISRLGQIYFEEGRYQRAAPFLYRGGQLTSTNLILHWQLGTICLAMGKFDDVRDQARLILGQRPGDQEAPLLLAEAANTPKNVAAARQQIQTLAASGATAASEVALGILAALDHDAAAAEKAFLQALILDPKSAAANSALGSLYLAEDKLAPAAAALKSAAQLSPLRSYRRILYARLLVQTGQVAEGKKLLEELTTTVPDYVPAWVARVEIALAENNAAEAKTLFASAAARDPESYEISLLGARVDLAQGEAGKAAAELERMTADYPLVAGVHYQLALACLAGNESGKAAASLNTAIKLDPGFGAAILLLARIQIKAGLPGQAVIPLNQLITREPRNLPARLLLADACRAQGDFDQALEIYRQIGTGLPADPQIPLLLGATYRQQHNPAAARSAFARALELAPDNASALEQLVDLDVADRSYADAGRRLANSITKNPRLVAPRLLQARVFEAQGATNQAEAGLLKIIEMDPAATAAYLLLAQLYFDSKQNQKALLQLTQARQQDPQNIAALMLAGVIHEQEKNYPAAADAYEQLLVIHPQFSPALNNLAYLYSEFLGRLDRASELAQKARALHPADPATADTLGWILYQKGQYGPALKLLQEAADQLAGEPEIQAHLGMVYYMMGNPAPARNAFQKALGSHPDFPGRDACNRCLTVLAIDPLKPAASDCGLLERIITKTPNDPVALVRLAMIYQRAGNSGKAIVIYEAYLKVSPGNVQALVSLAEIYATIDPAKAMELAKAAYKSAPDNSEVSHLAGRLAFQTGNYQWSLNLLQSAARTQPVNPQLQFDLAQSAYSMGRIPAAQAAMQNALQSGLPPAPAAEAKQFLDLLALAERSDATNMAGVPLGEVVKSSPGYMPALMVQAIRLELNRNTNAAEAGYEKILSHYPDFAPAQQRLAGLYAEDAGKADLAYNLAVKARETFPNDSGLARTLGIIAFHRNHFSAAAKLLQASATDHSLDAELYYCLGMSQYQLKSYADSKLSLRHALELNLSGPAANDTKRTLAELK